MRAAGWAFARIGRLVSAPPSNVMNSRRLIGLPRGQRTRVSIAGQARASQQKAATYVRVGSFTIIPAIPACPVRPQSGHSATDIPNASRFCCVFAKQKCPRKILRDWQTATPSVGRNCPFWRPPLRTCGEGGHIYNSDCLRHRCRSGEVRLCPQPQSPQRQCYWSEFCIRRA
jgi:hypothetical protein